LDENINPLWGEPLSKAGHEVETAAEESLQGAEDDAIAEACRKEGFCLITADLDFAQILDYPPEEYAGLVILRHPNPTLAGMQTLIRQIVAAVSGESPTGRIWIEEPGRLRIHHKNKEKPRG